MAHPTSKQRRAAWIWPWLLALAALGCAPDEAPPPDDHVAVKLTLDPIVYIDGAASPWKVVERIKNETRSVFRALREADVLVLSNQQVDVELSQIHKDELTLVDPAKGTRRPVTRVRFHYVTLAQVPKALADRTALPLSVLHSADASHVDAVLTQCSANGEQERQAIADPWSVYDASLPSCAEAVAREQAAIDAARKGLAHPDHEIVPLELDRVYLPVVVHIRPRQPRYVLGDSGAPSGREAPRGAGPGATQAPAGDPNEVVYVGQEEKDREREYQEGEDEKELARQARSFGGDLMGPAPAPTTFGSSPYLAPNFAVLYLAIIAFVVLLVGKTRRKGRR